jgi:2-oxoglutarate ferredoxin oxidoreductase subunit gamma
MLFEFTTAGFGGQGILYLGDLLAEAALREGRNVTFLPTYGVAMRGGTANCVVTISDDEIGSPLLDHPHAAVLMNQPSLVKFQGVVRPGGVIVANATMIDAALFNRDDVRIIWIPATEMARTVIGAERSANIVALGAFLKVEPVVKVHTIETIFRESAGRKKDAAKLNLTALHAGLDYILA